MSNSTAQKIQHVIPLGRRISEIMEEKGAAFSTRAFSQRLGISKDTLSRMITGERYISPTELEKIAKGLSVSVERIKQEDSSQSSKELTKLLDENSNPTRALVIAENLNKLAIGISEKCVALNNLARVLFDLGELDRAHNLWLEAYELAQRIVTKYNTTDILNSILSRLMISFTARKEYSRLAEILDEVEAVFSNNPAKLGSIYYSKAMLSEQFGNVQQERENLKKSLDYLVESGIRNQIGRAKLNLGYFEYKQKNYPQAKQYLAEAIYDLGGDKIKLIAIKEYTKTLLKLEEQETAIELIKSTIPALNDNPSLLGKFHILMTVACDDVKYVLQIVDDEQVGEKVRRLACKFLMNYYSRIGDSVALMKYYSKAEGLAINTSDILHEGDL